MKSKLESIKRLMLNQKSVLALLITAFLLTAAVLTGCTSSVGLNIPSSSTSSASTISPAVAEAEPAALFDENAVVSLYERAIPAVVQIDTVAGNRSQMFGPFGFNMPQLRGQGSGFIIDNQGHILTNNHVVDNATQIKVTLSDETELTAEALGNDPNNDLALLRVDPDKVSSIAPLSLGDSDKIKPGQMAIALGSPYGLEGSITVGVVSGLRRSIPSETQRAIPNVIQTDAAINPGNSGGPLLNSKGEVIGINTAIEASANSIGYAIPINTAKSLLPSLIKGGNVKSAWLGIGGEAITSELVQRLGLQVDKGVYIIEVMPDSPAQKAGLKESGVDRQREPTSGGDIITAVDGVAVSKVEDLISYLNGKKPGDDVTLSIVREGEQMTVKVTLGEWPANISAFESPSPQN